MMFFGSFDFSFRIPDISSSVPVLHNRNRNYLIPVGEFGTTFGTTFGTSDLLGLLLERIKISLKIIVGIRNYFGVENE